MKENNQQQDTIDYLLGSIQRVDAPEFLETRINARLQQQQDVLPTSWAFAGAAFMAILLLMNVWTLKLEQTTTQGADILVEEMHLVDDYDIYSN